MKFLCALLAFFLIQHTSNAQSLHGLWTGTLVNDSMHRVQNFELGLSEYRGKITGYTYTTFIDNDTFYYSIKRVRAERRDGKLVIEDDEMVANNFPERAAKHVKQITTFSLINDSTIDVANGKWNTSQTKRFYSIGGTTTLRTQDNEQNSDLLSHLLEANIKTDLAVNSPKSIPAGNSSKDVVKEQKKPTAGKDIASTNSSKLKTPVPQPVHADAGQDDKNKTIKSDQGTIAAGSSTVNNDISNNKTQTTTANVQPTKTAIADPKKDNLQTGADNRVNKLNNSKAATTKQLIAVTPTDAHVVPINNSTKKDTITTAPNKPDLANTNVQKQNVVAASTNATANNAPVAAIQALPTSVTSRTNESMQDVYFKNDSLVLSLYDNGIVDGDTVSVYLNGQSIVSRQMLKTSAIKKTVYIPTNVDSVQLVLFADNLGSIPPNTGLLTVRDGEDVYQVRFTADLQKNASIVLRRKRQ